MDIHAGLAKLGLKLPSAPAAVGAYVPTVTVGKLIFVAGQIPVADGKMVSTGPVPSVASLEQARGAARQCVLNALAVVDAELGGDWGRFERVVRLGVFVCCDAGFTDQAQVANAASERLGDLFGAAGAHARVAVGVNALPLGVSVELELLVAVR